MNVDELTTLEPLIRQYVVLPVTPNSRGWWPVVCEVCLDHGKKGARAAWMFEGEATAYHCFNCDIKAGYDPSKKFTDRNGVSRTAGFSPDMVKILDAYHVPSDEYNQILFNNLDRVNPTENRDKPKFKTLEPDTLQFPKFFYYLADAEPDDQWAQVATFYLEDRGIDPASYPFMLAKRIVNKDGHVNKWFKRIIIPIFKDNNLIFYQGRDLTGKALKKYESAAVPKDRILYGYDEIQSRSRAPLYIVEGWFDAYDINGIAIIGNKLTNEQIEILNRCPREKVYIPDRVGSGELAAEQAIALGWSVGTPDIGSCKDMNDAVLKYGKMYVLHSLNKNTSSGEIALMMLELYTT